MEKYNCSMTLKLLRHLTRMVGLSAFVSPDNFVIGPKVYESEFKATYSTFGTLSNPAAVTRSMGLPSDAPVVMVFASSSANFYTGRISRPFIGTSSSGPFYLEVKLIATYRDYAKTHANPDTDGT
jgi:hypothetical protein